MCEPGERSPYCDLACTHVYRHVNNRLPLRAHLCDHFILCLTTAIVVTTPDGLGFLRDTAAVPRDMIITDTLYSLQRSLTGWRRNT
jgi:hypothetical protein